jgi:hypothetical protein
MNSAPAVLTPLQLVALRQSVVDHLATLSPEMCDSDARWEWREILEALLRECRRQQMPSSDSLRRFSTYVALRSERKRISSLQDRITRLARVNGWGSAGQCPASHDHAKTPAVAEQSIRVAAGVIAPVLPSVRGSQGPAPAPSEHCSGAGARVRSSGGGYG